MDPGLKDRVSLTSINSDLEEERRTASFSPLVLTHVLDGGQHVTTRRRELEQLALSDDVTMTDDIMMGEQSHEGQYGAAVRKLARYLDQRARLGPDLTMMDDYFLRSAYFPFEVSPGQATAGMFKNVLEKQCTPEQRARWLPQMEKYSIMGTYAQTELGHGTHVRALETTALYDREREEFVLNSGPVTGMKWWPGSLGKTSTHAVVMATLMVGEENCGIHPFIIQVRDLTTHQPLPGVEVGDIGPKLGFNMLDNGFLRLRDLRIPRDNMLMRYAQVSPDGLFTRSRDRRLGYGTMMFTRAIITTGVARRLAAAVTIAVRYSCVRRQSSIEKGQGQPEVKVMEYQTQQYKLLPQVAAAYALTLAGRAMLELYFQVDGEVEAGREGALAELHALSAGLKAVASAMAMWGVEACRLACGGHGYYRAAGLLRVYVDTTAACTYEGDNTVLLLQTARYLVRQYNAHRQGREVASAVKYLGLSEEQIQGRTTMENIIKAYQHRARRLVEVVGERYVEAVAQGTEEWRAWNDDAIAMTTVARAHCELWVVESCARSLDRLEADESALRVLRMLIQLYALHGMVENSGEFLISRYLTPTDMAAAREHLLRLMGLLRPEVVALVDTFDFADQSLGSVLGRYDGRVYEGLWEQQEAWNQQQVHPAFHTHLKPLRQYLKASL